MKRLTLIVLVALLWCTPVNAGMLMGSVCGGLGCTIDSDSLIATINTTSANGTQIKATRWYAYSFTTTETKYITGGMFGCNDMGATAGYFSFAIWSDNAGEPGSLYGAGFTKQIDNGATGCANLTGCWFEFASAQTLPAGTYWMVGKEYNPNVNATNISDSATGTNVLWSTTGTGGSWSSIDYYVKLQVYGCASP